MNRTRLATPWLVVPVFALLGLLIGVLPAYLLSSHAERFQAQTTVAMLPGPVVPSSEASNYWEVLNRGQATRSAAIVLEDDRWLRDASSAAGVPPSELTLTAGAIPDTTLITITVEANSAKAAEAALQSVLTNALSEAAQVSGPFKLEVVAAPEGTARSKSPRPIEVAGAAGIAGMLVGAGVGVFVSRGSRARPPQPANRSHMTDVRHADGIAPDATSPEVPEQAQIPDSTRPQ